MLLGLVKMGPSNAVLDRFYNAILIGVEEQSSVDGVAGDCSVGRAARGVAAVPVPFLLAENFHSWCWIGKYLLPDFLVITQPRIFSALPAASPHTAHFPSCQVRQAQRFNHPLVGSLDCEEI